MQYSQNFEIRTQVFSIKIIQCCKGITVTIFNRNIISQLLRSGCSVGANYREANSAISHKDCLFRMRIARKEAKETMYWLSILIATEGESESLRSLLIEASELLKILSAMIRNKKAHFSEY